MKIKHYTFTIQLSMPIETVWKLLSDTDHLNRFIGLFPVHFSIPDSNHRPFFRWAEAKVLGMVPIRWKEFPFEWEQQSYYAVERQYETGPIERFYGGVRLKEVGHETEVTLFADFTPRGLLGLVGVPFIGKRAMKQTIHYLRFIAGKAASPSQLNHQTGIEPPRTIKWNALQLGTRMAQLKQSPVDLTIADLLDTHIRSSHDDRVLNMRPYEWADRWGVDRHETLRVFLYATKLGLTEISWHLMCPNCRVSKVEVPHLQDVQNHVHCDFCGIEYDLDFDQYVEIRFSVHPLIRVAQEQTYCVSGPMITPHILNQQLIKSGQSSVVPHNLLVDGKSRRLRVLQKNWSYYPNLMDAQLSLTSNGFEKGPFTPSQTDGSNGMMVKNQTGETQILVVEDLAWTTQLTTANHVTSMQEFRDLFSSEVLSPGTQIKVSYLAFLFSDLKGSTALYETKGDAEAYAQVRHHFELITERVKQNKGAVVKTIGDAVMAVFQEPNQAMGAATELLKDIHLFNEENGYSIILKLGLHAGSAIAVNSNDRLDYFGRTVNLAARIQGLSEGEDLVLSDTLLQDPSVQKILNALEVSKEGFNAQLKGIREGVPVTRIRLGDT